MNCCKRRLRENGTEGMQKNTLRKEDCCDENINWHACMLVRLLVRWAGQLIAACLFSAASPWFWARVGFFPPPLCPSSFLWSGLAGCSAFPPGLKFTPCCRPFLSCSFSNQAPRAFPFAIQLSVFLLAFLSCPSQTSWVIPFSALCAAYPVLLFVFWASAQAVLFCCLIFFIPIISSTVYPGTNSSLLLPFQSPFHCLSSDGSRHVVCPPLLAASLSVAHSLYVLCHSCVVL